MKKQFVITFLLSLVVCMSAFAQRGGFRQGGDGEPRTAAERANAQTNALEKKLGLNADQKGKIYEINLTAANRNEELRASMRDQSADRETFRASRVENEKTRDASIEGLLTPEQKVKYTELKEAQKEKMEERKENRKELKGKGKLKKADDDDDNDDN
jgi:Spy/CpxP family protein refolding chaperone